MRLDFLRPLYERRGPYASVYLAGFNPPERETRWRSLRERLAEADPATLDALGKAVTASSGALFATRGEVVLAEPLDAPEELVAWSPLPHVTPLLRGRGENVPHLQVIVDHAGAEVLAYGGGSPRRTNAKAGTWPLHKNAQGGWSRRHYERAVEQTWEHNAATVAHDIDEQLRLIGAELVVVAGEPRSRSLLCDHLGTKSADRVMMVEHGNRPDRNAFGQDVQRALDSWIDSHRAELLDRHRESEGPVGLAQTARALREGRVHAVLSPGELPERVWIGPGGTQLATSADELRRWGVDSPVQERADSAIARASAVTDAELWFSPEVAEVCAVLRY